MKHNNWGGPRKGAGGARRGAGRKPQSIRITVEDARAILDQNIDAGLFERLAQFVSKHERGNEMTTLQKLQYAQSRLAMAKMMGDTPAEIAKWQEHVAYWMEQRRQESERGD